jgi:hypothetical protein
MIKKIIRLGALLSIKESYLLLKNTYGLSIHPFKTLRSLAREKDRSQELLILGLPVYVLAMGVVVVWLGRKTLGTSLEWGWGAKGTAIVFLLCSILTFMYLLFWLVKTWTKK